ncbi:MAG: sortase [Chloroflexi bacterium]|nr:sortase [Chloroflexota bacterium]
MRDKRPVDELSVEDLERILVIKRREARQERLRRYDGQGRRVASHVSPQMIDPDPVPPIELEEPASVPQQHEAAHNIAPPEPPVTYDLTDDMPRFEDDYDDGFRPRPARKPKPGGKRARSRAWNMALLGIEVLALLGMAGVLVLGGYLIRDENKKIDALADETNAIRREALALLATPTPAPELSLEPASYVLPGGHYSPSETGEKWIFNFTELVVELPDSVNPATIAQMVAPQTSRTGVQPTSPVSIEFEIPAAEERVDASIFPGDDWAALQKGVGHHLGSANPGENGNMVLSAHNDIYDEIFRYIEYLEPGDEIRVMANSGIWYTYVVREKQVVDPTDIWVLEYGNQPMVTLITCHPYREDTQRMVVFADLVQ